jgi:flagellar capping protein FliD
MWSIGNIWESTRTEQAKSSKSHASNLEQIIEHLKNDLEQAEQKLAKQHTDYTEMENQLNSDVQYFKSLYDELKRTTQLHNEQNS